MTGGWRLAKRSPALDFGMMNSVRRRNEQVIDHLLCAAMIEGRSYEKFQILAEALIDDSAWPSFVNLVESREITTPRTCSRPSGSTNWRLSSASVYLELMRSWW